MVSVNLMRIGAHKDRQDTAVNQTVIEIFRFTIPDDLLETSNLS